MKSLPATLVDTTLNVVETVVKHIPNADTDPLLNARQFIGRPYPRVDGRLKVTGRATYAAEHPLDGMTHAALVHSPIARGEITQIDTQAVENLPGVLVVMTHRNAPGWRPPRRPVCSIHWPGRQRRCR